MNHVTRGTKKPVNMTLNTDLVREARTLTLNLSETVERLLSHFVAEQRAKDAEREQEIGAAIAFLNKQYETHGGLGEEFSPF